MPRLRNTTEQTVICESIDFRGFCGDIKHLRRILPMFDQRNGRYQVLKKCQYLRTASAVLPKTFVAPCPYLTGEVLLAV